VKSVDAWDWDSNKNFKFKVLEEEQDEECDEWNAESTLKLKEVVVSVLEIILDLPFGFPINNIISFWFQCANNSSGKQQRQMTPSNPNPLKHGSSRGISLSGHCTGNSVVTPTLPSKRSMRATTTWNVSECADVKCGDKIQKGVRRG